MWRQESHRSSKANNLVKTSVQFHGRRKRNFSLRDTVLHEWWSVIKPHREKCLLAKMSILVVLFAQLNRNDHNRQKRKFSVKVIWFGKQTFESYIRECLTQYCTEWHDIPVHCFTEYYDHSVVTPTNFPRLHLWMVKKQNFRERSVCLRVKSKMFTYLKVNSTMTRCWSKWTWHQNQWCWSRAECAMIVVFEILLWHTL